MYAINTNHSPRNNNLNILFFLQKSANRIDNAMRIIHKHKDTISITKYILVCISRQFNTLETNARHAKDDVYITKE